MDIHGGFYVEGRTGRLQENRKAAFVGGLSSSSIFISAEWV
jgi:hypothetical protein